MRLDTPSMKLWLLASLGTMSISATAFQHDAKRHRQLKQGKNSAPGGGSGGGGQGGGNSSPNGKKFQDGFDSNGASDAPEEVKAKMNQGKNKNKNVSKKESLGKGGNLVIKGKFTNAYLKANFDIDMDDTTMEGSAELTDDMTDQDEGEIAAEMAAATYDEEGEEGEGEDFDEDVSTNEETSRTRTLRGAGSLRGRAAHDDTLKKDDLVEEVEVDPITGAASSRRLFTGMKTNPIGLFYPLDCNVNLNTADCAANLFSSLATSATSPVVVPCGSCYTYDLGAGPNVIGGLDIQGKLYIPPNHKSELHTPYVFVQGELEMSDTNPISKDNESMKIVLTGPDEVTFTPVDSNANVEGGSFNAGFKPFLVAGGKLNIRGWNGVAQEGSPAGSWTPLLAMAEAAPPIPTLSAEPGHREGADTSQYQYEQGKERAPIEPPFKLVPSTGEATQLRCPRQLVNHNFTESIDHQIWSGGDGALLYHEGAAVLHDLHHEWQGFKLDFTAIAQECPLIDQATYLVTMRIKMTHPDHEDGTATDCELTGSNCPQLERRIYRDVGGDRAYDQDIEKGSIGKWGEWFHASFTWRWSAADGDMSDVTGQIFVLEKFPAGSTVYMDDFVFELPSEKSFANPEDPCYELVPNGDAEDNDGNGFAYYPWYSQNSGRFAPLVLEETSGNTTNKFYRARNRNYYYDSPQFYPNSECFINGFMYTASMRLRVSDYSGSLSYYIKFRGKYNGSDKDKTILECGEQTEADGWVTCSGQWRVDEEMQSMSQVKFQLLTQGESEPRDSHVIDYDDIHITFKSGPAEGLVVDTSAVSDWAANSDLHITSSTMQMEDSQDAVIQSIQSNEEGTTTVIKLETAIAAVLSEKDTLGMGVEVALLTRNIKIESDGIDENKNGYLQVFHTPGVAQTIEGVEFTKMGQKTLDNRLPIQFLYNRDVNGTSVSMNSIRDSNHCISLDGTSGVTLASNVAHDTTEQCYLIGDEATSNLVLNNLGSKNSKDTFKIKSSENDFIGNVAAGCGDYGWYVSLYYKTYGEDGINSNSNRIGSGGNMRRKPMGAFRGNTAHSNYRSGFYIEQFEQWFNTRDDSNPPIFENTKAYRNRERGIYSYNNIASQWRGGALHDNQWGIVLRREDQILLEDFDIKGATQVFKDHTITRSRKICSSSSSWRHEGILITPNRWRTSYNDPKLGLQLRNVNITGFDTDWYSCKSSEPIGYYSTSDVYDGHFDYVSSTQDVSIVDSRGTIIDGCRFASELGVSDIVINDLDGGLDLSGASSRGALVSNFPHVTTIFGSDACSSIENCMAYCPGLCLRTFTLRVEQFGTENWKLKITNNATGISMIIPGTIRDIGTNYFSYQSTMRKFSASLPAGAYTAEFLDDNDTQAWPAFVEETWEKEPDCSGSATPDSVTIVEPSFDPSVCDEFVRNNPQGATLTTTEPWVHTMSTGGTVEIAPGGGMDGSDALYTTRRDQNYKGFGQNIDSRCMKLRGGEYYDFSAWVRVTKSDGITPETAVDPDAWPPLMLSLNNYKYRNSAEKDFFKHYQSYERGVLARNYNASGWNEINGIFRLPTDGHHAFFEMDYAPKWALIYADRVSFSKMTCNPDELLLNGDLESGNSRYWDTWGTVNLNMVPGYGGTGSALRSYNRGDTTHSQSQMINTDCLDVGDRLMITAKIKFEDANGNPVQCNPFEWNYEREGGRCADIVLYTNAYYADGTRVYEYNRIAEISLAAEEVDDDGWYTLSGMWNVRPNQLIPGVHSELYFERTSKSKNIIVDNAQVKRVPQNCNALVENPSFEDSANFWTSSERRSSSDANYRGKISLYTPGAGGDNDSALRIHSRDSYWRGAKQRLDPTCFAAGEEYIITAKFRMLNSTGHGVTCDTNDQTRTDVNCPNVAIFGDYCEGPDVWWRFWNNLPDVEWDPDSFNDFQSTTFTVSEELATCDYVYAYVHYVDPAYDVVVDDLQISLYATPPPTPGPTSGAPEEVIESESPTSSPTSRPTVSTITPCPVTESTPSVTPAGPVMLARSDSLCILTKAVDTNGTLSNIAPVALSYDGEGWEAAAGEFATTLLSGQVFGNYAVGSHITLPELGANEKYYLTTYSHSVSETDGVARLLETATFGTTPEDLATWNSTTGGRRLTATTAKQWVETQMTIPMTSHREFFRKRANPRLTFSDEVARTNHPCDANARWRKYAFTQKDGDWITQTFMAVNGTDGYITIKLNSHVRTVVTSLAFDNADYELQFNREYISCGRPDEYHNGRMWLEVEDGSCRTIRNPLINFYPDSVQPGIVVNLPSISPEVLDKIDEGRSRGGDYIHRTSLNDPFCETLTDVTEELDPPVFGRLPDGSYLQYDPRMLLEENSLDSHIPDGGGLVRALTGDETRCANAPRTFLSEEECTLSYSSTTCGSVGMPDLWINLDADNINTLQDLSGQYVYAISGLPANDTLGFELPWVCEPGLTSRWEILPEGDCTATQLGDNTTASLTELLVEKGVSDTNIHLREILFPSNGNKVCNAGDNGTTVGEEIIVDSKCFRRVHPDHMNVYDFTYWTLENTHPGNMMAMMHNHSNPIKKWRDEFNQSAILFYPAEAQPGHPHLSAHEIHRWNTYNHHFALVGKFGDDVKFVDLPNEVRLDEVAEYFGANTELAGTGIMTCGSPYETSNDPTEGQVFEVNTGRNTVQVKSSQREYVWAHIGLTAPDQLRQRVAWALAQLLVIAEGAISDQRDHNEMFLTYYDIFVRHAFGNYRDVLREISYSPLMAENLSYLQSKSAAYIWEKDGKITFADENFAREIMQLFSTGMTKLNLDGTPMLDENGKTMLTYTPDEIMSFARVWTGFDYQPNRGNVEHGNRHDPMRIESSWRDKFPKSDMLGGYLGDGYPLCVDLPDKMFLRKGAVYRLLGSSSNPELMEDTHLTNDDTKKKLALNDSSLLKAELCNANWGDCQFANTVTLNHTLECVGSECDADTLRVVEVSNGIHYEYVRPACVEQVFYANPKKVIYRRRTEDSSCANPLLPYASEACCDQAHYTEARRDPAYLYDQERVTFAKAGSRCDQLGKFVCDFNEIYDISTHKKGYHWTSDSCQIQVKIDYTGQVALVYKPNKSEYLHKHVRDDNRNFFKVYWDGDYPKNDMDVAVGNTCGNNTCQSLPTGGCLCGTTITETRVFRSMPSSVEEILSKLTVGAFDPSAYNNGAYLPPVVGANGAITVYFTTASSGAYDTDTVFAVTDEVGRYHQFKNTKEHVRIEGAPEFAFRNAPSFMSVLNTEADARDAYYETEAALDHYFYHPNTAPFIAYRMIQRFTTSNPNPRYLKEVATAFRTGTYDGFGSGKYGDLGATIAAVLLDREARSVNLDAAPFKGNLREPILRVMALMRGMQLRLSDDEPVTKLLDMDTKIGMAPHSFPTVFSFILPEYSPSDSAVNKASLVAPETMIMDMPKVVGLLNGMFSLIKYGLSNCRGGFGDGRGCTEGSFNSADGHLTFSKPFDATAPARRGLRYLEAQADEALEAQADDVVNDLSTILTSGRLSDENKAVIKAAYISKLNVTAEEDPDAAGSALRIAQQLLVTTPEFHTTNIPKLTGENREKAELPQSSGSFYKAIVYVLFGGGCDSYQMLVPHTCTTGERDMHAQYLEVRDRIALGRDELRPLNNVTGQVCEKFGVHPSFVGVQQMFNDEELLFYANTGGLTKETDKENYRRDTEQGLFAHNLMQMAAQRVDPLKAGNSTGVLGRIRDALTKQGKSVGAFSIDANSISLIGEPGVTESPMILSNGGVTMFNEEASSDDMGAAIELLNGKTKTESGVFGEFYSDTLLKSLDHNEALYDTVSQKTTNVTFPNSSLGRQLAMVAKMIDSRAERGTDADVFFLSTGGWDTHSNIINAQVNLFGNVDAAFTAFANEMKVKTIWESVTLIQTSDFGRTLTPNGSEPPGTDHAWGGNYIMMGGAVKGGQIVGQYPSDIGEFGPLALSRGRMIPTTSWDAVFLPIADWAGVDGGADGSGFLSVIPNKNNYPTEHFRETNSLFYPDPTKSPTTSPSKPPTAGPSVGPSAGPTRTPTSSPTNPPTQSSTTDTL